MKSIKSISGGFNQVGTALLVFTGFAAYFSHPYFAIVSALIAGTQFKLIVEYAIEKSPARVLAAMVISSNVGPRDKRFREMLLLMVSRLEQLARKSQQLDDNTMDTVSLKVQALKFELEDIIVKEGL